METQNIGTVPSTPPDQLCTVTINYNWTHWERSPSTS